MRDISRGKPDWYIQGTESRPVWEKCDKRWGWGGEIYIEENSERWGYVGKAEAISWGTL